MENMNESQMIGAVALELEGKGIETLTSTVISGMRADIIAKSPLLHKQWIFEIKAGLGKPSFSTVNQASRLRDAVIASDPRFGFEDVEAIFVTNQKLESDLRDYAEKLQVKVVNVKDWSDVQSVVNVVITTQGEDPF